MPHTSLRCSAEAPLRRLFENFIDAGLHGRFDEALALIDAPYVGVGLGEQGLIQSRAEAELVLRDGYRADATSVITYVIQNFYITFLDDNAAMLTGQVDITNTPEVGLPKHSGLMQTIGARRKGDDWVIGFTHASPTILTLESVDSYPIRFMDRTVASLTAGLQAESILYAEVNLTQDTVIRLETKHHELLEMPDNRTFDGVIRCGFHTKAPVTVDAAVEQEYYAFWNRLRLLGLFAEGVTTDQFDYRMCTKKGFVWVRSAVEMGKHAYSGDIVAVVSVTNQDNKKLELEQYTHKAYHDALTGVLNRDGFESSASEILRAYDPQNYTALFMVDLDDFKQINDRLGHQVGDSVLQQVAKVLHDVFEGVGTVGRMGGDEFMALLTGDVNAVFLAEKADALLNAMKLSVGGSKQIPVSVSIGVAYGRARTTFENLYRIADIALYTAKRAGKCRSHLINTDTNTEHSGCGSNLLSLQSLLEASDNKVSSKTPYDALLDSIPGSVVLLELTDTSVSLTYSNRWLSRFLGYSKEEIEIQQVNEPYAFVHPEDVLLLSDIVQGIRQGADNFNAVYRVQHKDGHYRHIAMSASTTERRAGSVLMYGITTDIEEVVQLKQEVDNAHNKMQTLINSMPGGVVTISVQDTVTVQQCNNWISHFLGYEMQELEAIERVNPFELVHPGDLAMLSNAVARMHAGAHNVNTTYRLLGKDGVYRTVRNNASLVERRPDELVYYGVMTDVADQPSIPDSVED